MPSPRVSKFTVDAELLSRGQHTRDLPPASLELRAPSDVAERSDARRRREHPGKVGRPTNDEAAQAVEVVFEAMRKEIDVGRVAAEIGAGQDGRHVREIMASAKEAMQRRVAEYVDIHMVAAKVAALKGDAEPAQWALENISTEGARAVDPPQKHVAPTATTFNLGFVMGGMPQRAALPPAKE